MIHATFENLLDAAIYRANHGGWLFVDAYGQAQWFCAAHYTPTIIMLKTKGTGQLICDNRFLPKTYKPRLEA
jgi:hypothetical protein